MSRFIDDECSDDDSVSNSSPSLINGRNFCGSGGEEDYDSEEPTEEDKAFICDDSSSEGESLPRPVKKVKTIIDDDLTQLSQMAQPLDIPFDEEDDKPTTPESKVASGAVSPPSYITSALNFDPLRSLQLSPEPPKSTKKKQPKKKTSVVNTTKSSVIDDALEKGRNAPVKDGKKSSSSSVKQSKVSETSSELRDLIEDVNDNKSKYETQRAQLVIKFAKYLQRYKQD